MATDTDAGPATGADGRSGQGGAPPAQSARGAAAEEPPQEAPPLSIADCRAIIEHVPTAILILDAEGRCLFVNSVAARFMAGRPGDFVGRCLQDVVPDGATERTAAIQEVLATGKRRQFDEQFGAPGGRRWLRTTVQVLSGPSGAPPRLLVVAADITRRKQAEDELVAQRDLALALASAHALETGLSLCLDAAMRLTGTDAGCLCLADQARQCLRIVVHRGLSAEFVAALGEVSFDNPVVAALRGGQPVYRSYRELPSHPFAATMAREGIGGAAIVPILYKGQLVASLNVASHTLDSIPGERRGPFEAIAAQLGGSLARLQAEEARLHAERRASAQQRLALMGQLAMGVAHEFRSPLQGLLYTLDLLEERAREDAESRRLLEVTRKGLLRLDQLTEQLLRLSCVDTAHVADIPCQELLQRTLDLVRARAVQQGVDLVLQIEPRLPLLRCDVPGLSEAVLNLLANALDACEKGGKIKVGARRAADAPDLCEVTVEDNGRGMTPEVQAHAFEPFFTTRPIGKGAGLGLAIVKATMEKHGGTASLCSRPEGGTCVCLRLPIKGTVGKHQS